MGVPCSSPNRASLREIVELLEQADAGIEQGQSLTGGIYNPVNDDVPSLWSDFDPTGLEDALDYLDCY